MLVMNDCAIEPGDILFVVSNSSKPLVLFKQAAQSLTTEWSKHGHREVISVFVCTGKNKYGVICHNFERQLTLSRESFVKRLEEKSIEELTVLLLKYCNNELTGTQIKKALANGSKWTKQLAAQMTGNEEADELVKQFLVASKESKEKLIRLIVTFWRATGQAAILPGVNSSLLVFKHNDSTMREQFLDAYLAQVKVTRKIHAQGKNRTSLWILIKSFFQWSSQDEKDKEKLPPSDATYCSRNVMQILNQVDPHLVNRGRHVLPKGLEAGLREATKRKPTQATVNQEQSDDFENLIAAQELPPFYLQILPASGRKFISVLLEAIDKEIERIENKRRANAADRQKAADLQKQLLPFRNPKFQTYPVNLQVDVALELIATLMPTLQRKTGFFGEWIPATSYSNIRAFARTQGIFDGDIRDAIEKLKSKPVTEVEEKQEVEQEVLGEKQIYIFSDWSFSSWPVHKRDLMLEHMTGLLGAGHSLYTWENKQLVKMNRTSLQKAINGDDFDNLLAAKLKPASSAAITQQAELQKLDTTKLHFLDYKACHKLTNDQEPLETTLNSVASLFAAKIDEYHVNQAKQTIIDIEITNAGSDETEQSELKKLKEHIVTQKSATKKTYQSGVDTKAFVSQPQHRKAIFKPVDLMTSTPSPKYYRDEVYPDLVVNKESSSPFQYFELQGMNATENLIPCKYQFHPEGLTKDLIKKRKSASKLTLYAGEESLSLTENWQKLPSLHPNETLLDIAIKGLKKSDFEIKYSKENYLYYIRLTKPPAEPKDVSINLLMQMPKEYRVNPIFNTLMLNHEHQEIHRLLMKYLKFGKDNGRLRDSIDVRVHNGDEYLQEARKFAVASCRLRAIAFKEEMQRLYPKVPVSIVVNPDHCFIEMELNGSWQSYCLGGYRDTPGLVESVKENTLETLGAGSRKHQFFTEKTKVQSHMPVEQNTEEMSKQIAVY